MNTAAGDIDKETAQDDRRVKKLDKSIHGQCKVFSKSPAFL